MPVAGDREPHPARGFHALRVADVRPLNHDAVRVEFAVPGDLAGAFAFAPGQYLTLRRSIDGVDVRRPYSICSAAGEPPAVGIRRVEHGRFSSFACAQLGVGDTLEVMPPQGRFGASLDGMPRGANVLLLAAGSGITPMMSIAQTLLGADENARVTLVYGNRNTASIMFHEALDDLKNRYLDRFACLHVLSRETQDVALLNGRVDTDKLEALTACGAIAPADAHAVFVCGPDQMMDTSRSALMSLGAPADHIHAERFEAAADARPAPPSQAAQEAVRSGAEVAVVLDGARRAFAVTDPAHTVLEAAGRSGLELPFSCTGGMCATCRCKVLEGEVEMATNYSLEPWELEAGFVLACQSRPLTPHVLLDFDAT